MNKASEMTIPITFQLHNKTEREAMFPKSPSFITRCTEIGYSKLKENLAHITTLLQDMLTMMPETKGNFEVESATFALTIDGTGKISLIGEVSAGITSGITITIKRKGSKE